MKKLSFTIFAVCIGLLLLSCNSVVNTNTDKTQRSTLKSIKDKSRIIQKVKVINTASTTKVFQTTQPNILSVQTNSFKQPVKNNKAVQKETRKASHMQTSKLDKQDPSSSVIRNILQFILPTIFFLFITKAIQLNLIGMPVRLMLISFYFIIYSLLKISKKQTQDNEPKHDENFEDEKKAPESKKSDTEQASSINSDFSNNSEYYRRKKYVFQNSKSPFVILGVDRSASLVEVHNAYKTAIKRYHPDKFHNCEPESQVLINEIAKSINLAYAQIKKYKRV